MARIALVAHDEQKPALVALAEEYEAALADSDLLATGTTGSRLQEATGLDIERVASGRLGGDLMIGAEIAQNRVDGVVFLRDPLTAQPHEPDIGALLRICDVIDVPLATNVASARHLLDGLLA
jgi:methylglyoxal synthase